MKALIVIDVQQVYMEQYAPVLLQEINWCIGAARENGALVVYIKNVRRLRSGPQIDDLARGLAICSPHVFCKERASAFSNQMFGELLRQNDVSKLELVGVDGNGCVAASAVDARRCGYSVALPCRAIGVKNRKRFERTSERLQGAGVELDESGGIVDRR